MATKEQEEDTEKVSAVTSVETAALQQQPSDETWQESDEDAALSEDSSTSDDDDEEEEVVEATSTEDFLLRPPISEEELNAVSARFHKGIEAPLQLFQKEGYALYKAFLLREKEELEAIAKLEEARKLESLQDAAIRSNPRDYQRALFEVASQRNTIINLGTGKGKTLIALLVIRHFAAAFEKGKQTLFLVPSVALAIQQTTTLQANLPYSVATACRTVANAEQSRQNLANANIIVATHGAMHDLLMHYEDMFSMENFNLLVLDECHYATRNHVYASIMKKWYHPLPPKKRPHVLGLTASPLLHVKHTHSDDQLESMLAQLERRLDSRVACLRDLDMDTPESSLLHKAAEEKHILYSETRFKWPLPSCEDVGLHQIRHREFRQLDGLYAELGPLVTSIYCKTLAREISRNDFEQESVDEFRCVVQHLLRIASFCEEQCHSCPRNGRSDKLLALEEQLEELVEDHGGAETVGLVFVEQRITALALHDYFRNRKAGLDDGRWARASSVRHAASRADNIAGQFDDAASDQANGYLVRATNWPPEQEFSKDEDQDEGSDVLSQFADADSDDLGNDFVRAPDSWSDAHLAYTPSQLCEGAEVVSTSGSKSEYDSDSISGQFDDASDSSGSVHATMAVESYDACPPREVPSVAKESPVVSSDESGQFSDAEDDDDSSESSHAKVPAESHDACPPKEDPSVAEESSVSSDESGRFSDAADDDSSLNPPMPFKKNGGMDKFQGDHLAPTSDIFGFGADDSVATDDADIVDTIRTGVMVRHATHVFKYLSRRSNTKSVMENEAEKESWLHQETRIRDVMRRLRKKETNVLIATSIVEEGVDVQACSFVIVFDALKSAKAYIQMKGRARQQDAKFVVLQSDMATKAKGRLLLETAQHLEQRVHDFIEKRDSVEPADMPDATPPPAFLRFEGNLAGKELKALQAGKYQAEHGSVDLTSAKGLLNKYAMSIPLDPSSRTTRESFLMHMPFYENYQLMLPSHLPAEVRLVRLPEAYHGADKTERHQMLSLMACARLHGLRLLSDRLLPLTRNDLHEELLRVAKQELPSLSTYTSQANVLLEQAQQVVYLYPIAQTGDIFGYNDRVLKSGDRTLALLSLKKLPPNIPDLTYPHNQLGDVTCSLGEVQTLRLSLEEWEECALFYATLFNGRWRHRTRGEFFRYLTGDEVQGIIPPYVVGCLSGQSGELDWSHMRTIIAERSRDEQARTSAVRGWEQREPRLWSPLYDPHVTYISYGPSGLNCGAKFPDTIPGVETFQDYFAKQREFEVPKDARLFVAQRLWHLQSESLSSRKLRLANAEKSGDDKVYVPMAEPEPPSHQLDVCKGLISVLLPLDACMETEVADAHAALLSTMLPQFLYHIECYLTVDSFHRHCSEHLPVLGRMLEKVPRSTIIEALAAKSCQLEECYDRLEWLGDAVLKLLQTDALLQAPDLRKWVHCLHEGDLTKLRSEMGCNERLAYSSRCLGIDKFILYEPLERGKWTPAQLQLCASDGTPMPVANPPSMKVCADMVEALLGLVYVSSGYEASVAVAKELGVSLPTSEEQIFLSEGVDCVPRPALVDAVKASIGKGFFNSPHLIEEAVTHPSAVYQDVSSYQRLEWVGDAVLCLAMRQWVYFQYPSIEIGDSVNMESALVSNETLAYLCYKNGLHAFINHRDQGLPSRIEHYEWCIKELGRGLWGTDPPKVISDVVEALLGAAHVDGGFVEGQKAALGICEPITSLLQDSGNHDCIARLNNPKTTLHALAGNLLSISASKEEEVAKASPDEMVWQGDRWRHADEEGSDYVASISCLGMNVLSIAESSKKSGRNRACAMVVAFIERDAELLSRLQNVRGTIDLEKAREANNAAVDGNAEDDGSEEDN